LYEDITKDMMELYSNPLFKKAFQEFSTKLQQEGVEAARKFWDLNPNRDKLFNAAPEFLEQMISFYSSMGFVPLSKHEEVVKENEKLKKENQFLKDTIRELQEKVFTEGSAKVQEAWTGIVEKQIEVSKDIAKNFFDLFKQKDQK